MFSTVAILLTVCWKVTNCTPSWALSIATAVHYCTHDVLMNTKTTFKFLVVLCWAVTGSAGWCVRSRFAWSAHEQVAMYTDARLKLSICLLRVECGVCHGGSVSVVLAWAFTYFETGKMVGGLVDAAEVAKVHAVQAPATSQTHHEPVIGECIRVWRRGG